VFGLNKTNDADDKKELKFKLKTHLERHKD